MRARSSLLLVAVLALAPTFARAEDKSDCAAAYVAGQRAKLHGELGRARELLRVCARDVCPASLQPDCVQWLADVDRAMPSIIVQARDAAGQDLAEVAVLADGKPLVDHLDGKPIELDPGEHVLRFVARGQDIPERRVVLIEGQKARVVVAVARGTTAAPLAVRRARPVPTSAWVTGAVSIAALGTFAAFGATGVADYSKLPACKCGPGESWDKTEFTIASVALGVGIAALAITAIVYLTRPTKALPENVATIRF